MITIHNLSLPTTSLYKLEPPLEEYQQRTIDNIVFSEALYPIAKRIKKELPYLKFGLHPEDSIRFHERLGPELNIVRLSHPRGWCAVYREGEPFITGIIGFGHTTENRTTKTKPKYYVQSHLIDNQKIVGSKPAGKLKKTVSPDKMHTLVKTYIAQPVSLERSLAVTKNDFISTMRNEIHSLRTKLLNYKNTVVNSMGSIDYNFAFNCENSAFQTMLNIVDTGRVDESSTFFVTLKDYVHTAQLYQERFFQPQSLSMVVVKEVNIGASKEISCEGVVLLKNEIIESTHSADDFANTLRDPNNYFRYFEDQLPHNLAQKLAVLNVLEDGAHVQGVGYKFNSQVFYVYTDPTGANDEE